MYKFEIPNSFPNTNFLSLIFFLPFQNEWNVLFCQNDLFNYVLLLKMFFLLFLFFLFFFVGQAQEKREGNWRFSTFPGQIYKLYCSILVLMILVLKTNCTVHYYQCGFWGCSTLNWFSGFPKNFVLNSRFF